jgi:cytochrome oxidase Cu insertion factor (SCO1/SenC/PrrC family)
MTTAKIWALAACCLVAIYGSYVAVRRARSANEAFVGPATPVATGAKTARPPLDEFTLTDQYGKPFNSESLRGKVWVASFFFTNCPAVCWRLNQTLAAIQETDPQRDVRYVSITCDPENDTPEALLKYAEHFKANPTRWTFLTGPMDLIQRIGQDFFQISVEKGAHTDRACVVDRNGKVRGRFRLTEPDQVEMLKKLLDVVEAEEPAPAAAPSEAEEPAEEKSPETAASN